MTLDGFFDRACANCGVPAKIVAAGLCQRCVDAHREAERMAKDFETLTVEGSVDEGRKSAPLSEEPERWL